jgi:hypothetical protein
MRLLYGNARNPVVIITEIYYNILKQPQVGFLSMVPMAIDVQKINHYHILPIAVNHFGRDPMESIKRNKNSKGRFIYEFTESEVMDALTFFKDMDLRQFILVKDNGEMINYMGRQIN